MDLNFSPTNPLQEPPILTETPSEKKKNLTWIALGLIAIVLLIGIPITTFLLSQNAAKNVPVATQENTTITEITPPPDPTADWKTYQSLYFSFKYPFTWSPQSATLSGAIGFDNLKLGIPNVISDQTIGFSPIEFSSIKASDSASQSVVTIGGKTGTKWIRKGINYVSYDYYTTGMNNSGSFGLHVTVPSEDKNLENQLDLLVATIKFTPPTIQTGLATYISKLEPSLSFKYPTTWTPMQSTNSASETLILTSKNGTKITYSTGGNYIGGACSQTATDKINQVVPLLHAAPLNLIDISISSGSASLETLGIDQSSPKLGNIANCSAPHLVFNSKTKTGNQIIFETSGKIMDVDKNEVLQILESLTY